MYHMDFTGMYSIDYRLSGLDLGFWVQVWHFGVGVIHGRKKGLAM